MSNVGNESNETMRAYLSKIQQKWPLLGNKIKQIDRQQGNVTGLMICHQLNNTTKALVLASKPFGSRKYSVITILRNN